MHSLTSLACMVLATLVSCQAQEQTVNSSSLQGFNNDGISVLNQAMHRWVDDKQGAGVVTLLSRHGKIVNFDAYGSLDAAAGARNPLQKDTIFRIMSMTKPIVGVAMMMMYEAGKWKLDDPVSKHIPEFADLKVQSSPGTSVPQATPMTMAQLMSHSAGFPGQLTVRSPTLQTIIEPLVKGQLAFQPGRGWKYGPGVEIQGYLIERWAGKDLSDFLTERLLQPLKMVDSGFYLDPSKRNRVTKVHSAGFGGLAALIDFVTTSKPKRISPSGGLYSTAMDYWRFCQMLLNNGTFEGNQYLKPETVELMHTNVLAADVPVGFGRSSGVGTGFGLDFAVVLDPKASNTAQPKGTYYWGGAYGTWFWIDPKNEVVFVGMIQNTGAQLSGDTSLRQVSAKAVYSALQ